MAAIDDAIALALKKFRPGALRNDLTPSDEEVISALAGRRISTRFPTAMKATEDPMSHNLIIDTDAMRRAEKAFAKNTEAVAGYAPIKTRARSPEGRAQAFTEQTADNLLWLHDQVPAEIRDITGKWYVGANRIAHELSQKHGISVEEAGGVIASLSPQKDWYQNVSLAERVVDITDKARKGGYTRPDAEHLAKAYQIFSRPQYRADLEALSTKPYEDLTDTQKAMFVRSYDEAFNDRGYDIISPTGDRVRRATTGSGAPGTAAWGSNVEIAKAIRVIEDPSLENISRQMGEQHKVRNFYNNIVDPFFGRDNPDVGDFTSDTHNVAASLVQPLGGSAREVTHNFGGTGSASSAFTGAQGTYGLYADAGRMAAKEAGILPREMQSITWEAIRDLFPATFKANKGNVEDIENVWKLHRRGAISKDQARDLILEKAGGMDGPDWVERPNSGVHVPASAAADQGDLHQPGVSGSRRVDSRARLVAAGVPATWLGLGGAGALTSQEASAAPSPNEVHEALSDYQRRRQIKESMFEGFTKGLWNSIPGITADTLRQVSEVAGVGKPMEFWATLLEDAMGTMQVEESEGAELAQQQMLEDIAAGVESFGNETMTGRAIKEHLIPLYNELPEKYRAMLELL